MAKAIMFCGTASGVGKSIITTAFCRILANKGYSVAPFKSQNMSLNSITTPDGFEISIAQNLQATAARVMPDWRMNPILLKPDGGKTYIVRKGKPFKTVSYGEYYKFADEHFEIAKDAFDSLSREFDFIVMEGAGSPAEINLQKYDIVNLRMAGYAKANVYIVGDIDKGGVFAAFKGTFDLIKDKFKPLVKGFIINKFRGDINLLKPAFDMFKNYCSVPILGVVPFVRLKLDEEDSLFKPSKKEGFVKICVIKLPYMSNFTDFGVFEFIDDVSLKFIDKPEFDDCDMVIIPGSKAVDYDLNYLYKAGFYEALCKILSKKLLIGVCGGYQMLGEVVGLSKGFGFLKMTTEFSKDKKLINKTYKGINYLKGANLEGYEIHHGLSEVEGVIQLAEDSNVCVFEESKKIIGTYLHGIFNNREFLKFIFNVIGKKIDVNIDIAKEKDKQIDMLAEIIENSLPVDKMIQ
ncbi:cobyric acid synthase [Hippea alviniae]|uniref:cobyric acid synthase n=1 Tax=Hippea alviniae TaxID=1279027 RepID=UPI0003B54B20|nr:cobyric acid synthase [Hippea alviniae]